MQWTLAERGFLPTPDPLTALADDRFAAAEQLGKDLPRLVYEQRFRDEAPKRLAAVSGFGSLADAEAERLFMLYSYFASAFVHAPGMPPVPRLPAEIAGPLVQLGQICQRPPILAYASYCLHNWRRIEPHGPIALGNIALLQNFSLPGEGKSDEDWFILVHVDIEARAGRVLTAFQALPDVLKNEDDPRLENVLQEVIAGLRAMNKTMDRMPEGCSPEVYFRKVRPYIFGFNDVVYEGCFGNAPQTFRGETGAQSSIVPTALMALGIRHQDSLLTKHLDDMRHYMPAPRRRFIEQQVSVREPVLRVIGRGGAHLRPSRKFITSAWRR